MNLAESSFRRQIVGLLLLAICSTPASSVSARVPFAPTQRWPTFDERMPANIPLKVRIEKDTEERSKSQNKSEWRIEVTNTSDKPIYFFAISVMLTDDLSDADMIEVYFVRYGRGEFYEHNTKPLSEDKPIEPKGTQIFTIEQNRIGFMPCPDKNYKTDPKSPVVWFHHLNFGDGTGFTSLTGVAFPFKNPPWG